jgi:hypothetical protein
VGGSVSKKYIVFKREEFEEWCEDEIGLLEAYPPPPDEVEPLLVIVKDDGSYRREGEWAQI